MINNEKELSVLRTYSRRYVQMSTGKGVGRAGIKKRMNMTDTEIQFRGNANATR